jgi:hypothetical protein
MAEPHFPGRRPKGQSKAKDHKEGHGIDVPIAERRKDRAVERPQNGGGLIWKGDGPKDQAANQNLGGDRNILGETPVETGVCDPNGQTCDWWFDGHFFLPYVSVI